MNNIYEDFYCIENDVLSILLTTKCNQDCIMCPQLLNNDLEDINSRFEKFLLELPDMHFKEIYITGGEPFLKSEWINRILESTNNERVTILTNGVIKPTEEILKAKRITLCIPLYASYDELHNRMTGSNNFYNVVNNLIDYSVYKIPIELRFVITKQNYNNMLDFAQFVSRNLPFVSNVAFMGIELMEQGDINKENLWINPSEFMKILCESLDYLLISSIPVSLYNIPHCVIPQKYHFLSFKSISEWKRKYFDFCTKCKFYTECGGFFASCKDKYKEIIKGAVI